MNLTVLVQNDYFSENVPQVILLVSILAALTYSSLSRESKSHILLFCTPRKEGERTTCKCSKTTIVYIALQASSTG